MGVDTILYVNGSTEIEDIVTILIKHLSCTDVEVRANTDVNPGYFNIFFTTSKDNKRMLHLWTNSQTPIGPAMYLSFGADKEGQDVLRTIAEILGGLFCPNDCAENYIMYRGKFWKEDGLAYHLRYAVLNNTASGDDMYELNDSIRKWNDRIGPCANRTIPIDI
jgi:hypothetical protein